MKRKLIAALVVILLFGGAAFALLGTKESVKEPSADASGAVDTSGAAVKICPHSGLPCDGDGDCQDDECADGESCGSKEASKESSVETKNNTPAK